MQSGIYSINSSYYFLKSEARSTTTQAQAKPYHPKPPWNRIWKLSLPKKIKKIYGEQPVMHCPQVQNWFGDATSTIQPTPYAQVTVKMLYTLCGPVRLCHKCGKEIRNGVSNKRQGIPISHNCFSRYWTQHAMWNNSLQSHGQSGSEETKSDLHHRGSLWTK